MNHEDFFMKRNNNVGSLLMSSELNGQKFLYNKKDYTNIVYRMKIISVKGLCADLGDMTIKAFKSVF